MHSLSLCHKWTLDELHFSESRISKWRSLNCKLTGVFRKQARLSTVERARVHMVARLTKISNTLSRYFRIAQVEALFRGSRLFISGNPVVFLCGQIKPCCSLYIILYSLFFRNLALFYTILNGVYVFKLSAVTAAHVSQKRYRTSCIHTRIV